MGIGCLIGLRKSGGWCWGGGCLGWGWDGGDGSERALHASMISILLLSTISSALRTFCYEEVYIIYMRISANWQRVYVCAPIWWGISK
jgi:hypothetical protein